VQQLGLEFGEHKFMCLQRNDVKLQYKSGQLHPHTMCSSVQSKR